MENFNIQEELKKLPGKPGVYLMHDEKDAIIYVGKAISLKNRVRQYFQSSRNKGLKIEQMVPQIARFEYIVTDSELEALVLETDSPYLAPVPHRGKRNNSQNLVYVAEEIAALKGVSYEEVVRQTTENAKKLYRLEK